MFLVKDKSLDISRQKNQFPTYHHRPNTFEFKH